MEWDNIEVILVNPKYPENIGAVCRAMKTMGISTLSIVKNTAADKIIDNFDKIRILAVHATDIAEKARYFNTLQEAIKETTFVAGISRRRGKKRKYFALTPEELADKIHSNPGQRVALVFGNEETGLTENELSACHVLVNIPSSPDFPSLNLSHAVQIITYIISREYLGKLLPGYRPVSGDTLEHLVSVITQSLHNIGFFTMVNDNDLGIFFRDILARSGLTIREVKRLEKVFRKISGMIADKGVGIE